LAEYTKLNLKEDVEDQAPRFGMSPDMEARMARVPLELEGFGVTYQRLAPNYRLPFGHKHKQQEEVYVVVGGGGRARLEDEVVELKRWDALRVPKDTTRGFEAGPEGMEVIAIGAPNTGPGDAEMDNDFWSD
jgi:mannose-6-phosphate isomerase-like protein (cupin superfamily)